MGKILNIFVLFILLNVLIAQKTYIRSTLPLKDSIIIHPDNGRPFNELAAEYYDNGQVKLKGRYSGGLANGYWAYFYQNGPLYLYDQL